ncbi:MAG: N-acetylmannosamine-6-phosphate 2-epimerase [Lachnospiraceae bacterium]|nr:N-acetylmannosamine-6-phosphate 2-epimerase [Lachnospiraceae bacterium]
MSSSKKELIESMRGLIVSCQTQPGDPIHTDDMVVKMAEAAQWGGAVGIRSNSPEQIAAIKKAVDLPIIGLWKIESENSDVFITPTLDACKAVWEAGADIIALDCTSRLNAQGRPAYELITELKKEIPEAPIFADISTFEEAKRAAELGADIVAPTLFGYTEETKRFDGPNMRDFAKMCRELGKKAAVMMEGHIKTPEEAVKCMYLGAHSVIVGSAITRPHFITQWFTEVLSKYEND